MIGWMVLKDGSTYGVVQNFTGQYIIFPELIRKKGGYYITKNRYFKGVLCVCMGDYVVRIAEEVDPPRWAELIEDLNVC